MVGCGGVAGGTTVVHVGEDAITKATVEHWVSVIKRGGAFSGPRGEAGGDITQRALALLITSNWLVREGAHQGVPVRDAEVEQALREREREDPELGAQRRAAGQTVADLKLELRAELAAEALRKKLARRAERIGPQELVAFYDAHRSLFGTGMRVTDLIEGQESAAAAAAAAPQLDSEEAGSEVIHEHVTRAAMFMRSPEKVKVVDQIFTARPGVVSRPVLLNKSWAVFVVRKVIPGRTMPFGQARAEVLTRLAVARELALARSFDRSYTARWKARTSCRAGFVGPGCPQSTQPLGAYEDPFSPREHALLAEPMSYS